MSSSFPDADLTNTNWNLFEFIREFPSLLSPFVHLNDQTVNIDWNSSHVYCSRNIWPQFFWFEQLFCKDLNLTKYLRSPIFNIESLLLLVSSLAGGQSFFRVQRAREKPTLNSPMTSFDISALIIFFCFKWPDDFSRCSLDTNKQKILAIIVVVVKLMIIF